MSAAITTIALSIVAMFGQISVPKKWNPDLVIRISHTGSMSGTSTQVKYTYEVCEYEYQPADRAPVRFTFRMTEPLRAEILAHLRSLKLEQVRSEGGTLVVNDGWAQSICVGTECLEGGTSAEMSREDKDIFLTAYGYLEQFALDHNPR